jgi:hypothetical protein
VEPRFRAKNNYEEWDRFDPFAIAALSKEIIQLCCSTTSRTLTRTSRTPGSRRISCQQLTFTKNLREMGG